VGEGLAVEHGDALSYLERTEPASLGGIFAAHVVEHLRPAVLVRFLELAAAVLRPGGLLVLETPNPVSLVALKHYFADLTHVQPLVPETLAFLVRQAGLAVEETRYLNEPPAAERLQPVRLPAGAEYAEAQAGEDANVRRLNEVVFGPQDYAVVARR
jgi:O-antigen chain-terminating methyltransferase